MQICLFLKQMEGGKLIIKILIMKKCEVNNICSSWLFRIVLTAQNGLKRITVAFILKAAAVRVFEKCFRL